jgi:glycerol-3-phosphate dehydrogenase (NAD(P)+)
MKPFVSREAVMVSASKGIENKTHLTMTGILAEILDFLPPENLAVLSGPSFAKEVAAKIPTVVAAASVNDQVARFVQAVFACPTFRVYVNHDPIGTQIGGAMKNVLAIAAGI